MKLLLAAVAAVISAVAATPAVSRQLPFAAHADPATEAPLLSAATAETLPDQYIVVLRPGADVAAHHAMLYETLVASGSFNTPDAANQLRHVYRLSAFQGYSGKFTPAILDTIRASPDVAYVERDQVVRVNELQRNAPWGLSRVAHREPLTFRNFNRYLYDARGGEGVTAYVVDTGINIHHVDFEGRASWGATIPDGDADEDGNGHGTHVAGTMVGGRYGVAKKARVVAVKVLRSNGSGTMADVVRGVEWVAEAHLAAVQADKAHRGSVANMSLGGGMSKALNAAVNAAVESGVHFAVAAGNDDSDACDYSPASAELPVTVGASTIEDERAWFSNKGKCVDVFAPGKDIASAWIGGKTATNTISGTSMASPHVAGLLAYLLSLEDGPVEPKTLKKKLIALATADALQKIPADTPNLLIFSDPPAAMRDEDEIEARVEERVDEILGALKTVFELAKQEDDATSPALDDSVELEWTWV
jgi:cerevisin